MCDLSPKSALQAGKDPNGIIIDFRTKTTKSKGMPSIASGQEIPHNFQSIRLSIFLSTFHSNLSQCFPPSKASFVELCYLPVCWQHRTPPSPRWSWIKNDSSFSTRGNSLANAVRKQMSLLFTERQSTKPARHLTLPSFLFFSGNLRRSKCPTFGGSDYDVCTKRQSDFFTI